MCSSDLVYAFGKDLAGNYPTCTTFPRPKYCVYQMSEVLSEARFFVSNDGAGQSIDITTLDLKTIYNELKLSYDKSLAEAVTLKSQADSANKEVLALKESLISITKENSGLKESLILTSKESSILKDSLATSQKELNSLQEKLSVVIVEREGLQIGRAHV